MLLLCVLSHAQTSSWVYDLRVAVERVRAFLQHEQIDLYQNNVSTTGFRYTSDVLNQSAGDTPIQECHVMFLRVYRSLLKLDREYERLLNIARELSMRRIRQMERSALGLPYVKQTVVLHDIYVPHAARTVKEEFKDKKMTKDGGISSSADHWADSDSDSSIYESVSAPSPREILPEGSPSVDVVVPTALLSSDLNDITDPNTTEGTAQLFGGGADYPSTVRDEWIVRRRRD